MGPSIHPDFLENRADIIFVIQETVQRLQVLALNLLCVLWPVLE